MSGFKSESSRVQALSNVNKLLLDFLPGSEEIGTNSAKTYRTLSSTSGALIIHQKISSKKNIHENEEISRKLKLKEKLLKRKKILQNLERSKQVNKVAKIEKLKKDKRYNDAELQEIIQKKLKTIKSWEILEKNELKSLEQEILQLSNKDQQSRKKIKQKNQKKMDFNRKLQKGIVAYPGLTPGLAPVDLTDDDEDSD